MPQPKKFDIITFGNATRDVFLRSRKFRIISDRRSITGRTIGLVLGAKLEVDDVVFETGGGATNTAVCFNQLGYRTAFVGRLGKFDARGREIIEKLSRQGIDTSLVRLDADKGTAYSIILLTRSGERTILVYRGASTNFDARDIAWSKLNARWFYITSMAGNLPVLGRLVDFARRRGIKVALNPGAVELEQGMGKLGPILKGIDILFLNLEEAARLTGLPYGQENRIFKDLCVRLPGLVVITAGRQGAIVCDNQKKYRSGTNQIKVIDATGAGDAFGSGFLAAYLKRPDIAYALRVATINSESVIQKIGAKQGLLTHLPARPGVPVHVENYPN